jgi:hypothetical protein
MPFGHFDALQYLRSFALEAPLLPQVPVGHVTPVKRLELMPLAPTSPVLSMSGIAATAATTKIFNISSLLNDFPEESISSFFKLGHRQLPEGVLAELKKLNPRTKVGGANVNIINS